MSLTFITQQERLIRRNKKIEPKTKSTCGDGFVLLEARTPLRIDLSGGFSDLPRFASEKDGFVLSTTIDRYVHVSLSRQAGDSVTLYASDLQRQFDMPSASASLQGLPLAEAVLAHMHPRGCHITTRSDVPEGSGLGASGAFGVALVSILRAFSGEELAIDQIANIANRIERESGSPCGKQDQYASLLGGFNVMRFRGESVAAMPLNLSHDVISQLQKHLLLVYTRKRESGSILQKVVAAYDEGDSRTHEALSALRQIPEEMKTALIEGDLSGFGQLLAKSWSYQKQLHPSVTTKQIEALFEIAAKHGCMSGKACGAGGGGCLVFYCPGDRKSDVAKALTEVGAQPIDFQFDFTGLTIWRASDSQQ